MKRQNIIQKIIIVAAVSIFLATLLFIYANPSKNNKAIYTEEGLNIETLISSAVSVVGLSGIGSGTIIKKTNKHMYILTCYHVIVTNVDMTAEGEKPYTFIRYSKTDVLGRVLTYITYSAEIIKTNKNKDLALLRTDEVDDNLNEVKITSTVPELGNIIYSIGCPLGLERTISRGILSNHLEGFWVSDNTTTFGNSGGGLYNIKGELIGVPSNVYGYSVMQYFVPESGLGLSIDLFTIKNFLFGVMYE